MIMLSCCSENFIAMSLSPWSGAFTAGRQAVDLPLILKRQADSWPLSGGSTAAQRLVPLQAVGLPLPSGGSTAAPPCRLLVRPSRQVSELMGLM